MRYIISAASNKGELVTKCCHVMLVQTDPFIVFSNVCLDEELTQISLLHSTGFILKHNTYKARYVSKKTLHYMYQYI